MSHEEQMRKPGKEKDLGKNATSIAADPSVII